MTTIGEADPGNTPHLTLVSAKFAISPARFASVLQKQNMDTPIRGT